MTLAERPSTVFVAENHIESRTDVSDDQVLLTSIRELLISVRPDEDGWIAVEHATGLFGEGDDQGSALQDLARTMNQVRDELRAQRDQLGDHLREQLAILERSLGT